jgi:hypothetical protein
VSHELFCYLLNSDLMSLKVKIRAILGFRDANKLKTKKSIINP